MTSRAAGPVGRRQLEQIASRLSERDRAVIASVAKYRFLTARQIERLHFPVESHTELGAVRASRRALERLHGLGILSRLERRVGGVRAGSAGYCYCLGPLGVRLVDAGTKRAIAREPSTAFLDHHLAVADVVVSLVRATRSSELELLAVEAEPACWRRSFGSGGANETLKPDLYVVMALGDYESHAFVEVDLGTEHATVLERKAAQYERYLSTGLEQQRLSLFPAVVWLTSTDRRVDLIRRVLMERTPGLFRVGRLDEALLALAGTA